jgi:hypothetical protein
VLTVPGVEADDVIGTLARLGEASGHAVLISTGDKDLAQLVTPQVTLINTMSNERLDPAGVLAKFGVPPERIVDYLTLMGDAVDNVPGVDKVGPKTAAKWLAEYGTLDGVVANAAGAIKGVAGENLQQALDWLPHGPQAGHGEVRLRALRAPAALALGGGPGLRRVRSTPGCSRSPRAMASSPGSASWRGRAAADGGCRARTGRAPPRRHRACHRRPCRTGATRPC